MFSTLFPQPYLLNSIYVTFYVGTLVTCVTFEKLILWVKYNKINGIYFFNSKFKTVISDS